jgi:hypothetical protein
LFGATGRERFLEFTACISYAKDMVNRPAALALNFSGPGVVPYEQRLDADLEWALSEGSLFFEDRGKVQESLARITRQLNELRVPYAVADGMALYRHGFRRFTEDVDILVTRESLKRIHEALDGRGFVRPFEKSKNLRDAETGVKIEFLLTGDYPGDGKPKEVAFPDPAEVAIDSGEIKIVGLTTLIALKLASGMTGADRRKDLVDVEELVKILKLDESLAASLPAMVQEAYREICQRLASVSQRFRRVWRRPADASQAIAELAALRQDGVTIEFQGTTEQWAYVSTEDPAIAAKYGMAPEDEFFDDETDT